MSPRITIFEPTAEESESVIVSQPYLGGLAGKRIGIASNEFWQCLETIWKTVTELLSSRNQVAGTTKFYVPMTEPATPSVLDDIARQSDAAIVGLAGGGAGGAWLIHDTIELIKRKLPAVALINEDFLSMSRMIARSRGLPHFRYVVLPRNINSLPPEQVKEATLKVYEDIIKLLTGPNK